MAKIIRVTADRDGLNRGGIIHPKGTTDYPREDLTDQQIDHFKLEPWLTVEELDLPDDTAAKGKKKSDPAPTGDSDPSGNA